MTMSSDNFVGRVDSYGNDRIGGWIADPSEPERIFDVDLYVEGQWCARVCAGFPREDLAAQRIGSGANAFYFLLPPARHDEEVGIEVRESVSQRVLPGSASLTRLPSPSFSGLQSTDAAAMMHKPVLGIGSDAFAVRANAIIIKGMYLPPGGDPFAYEVIAEPGVAFTLVRPIFDERQTEYFWFWPNAAWSSWRIEIDLSRTVHQGDSFRFTFRPTRDPRKDCEEVVIVPKDLGLWQQLPDEGRLLRVQLGDFPEANPIRAAMHWDAILQLAMRHMGKLRDARVLDWGCGWGRLMRSAIASGGVGELWGADIDEDNLAWARENIPGAKFTCLPLYPPTNLPSGHFDLVYALSVMTHLDGDAQDKWIEEVARVLRPGGCAVLTFHGRSALGFSSRYLSTRTVENFERNGFDDATECGDLEEVIGAGYYKNTYQSHDDVRTRWGAHLRVVEIIESGVGIQDVALLVKD